MDRGSRLAVAVVALVVAAGAAGIARRSADTQLGRAPMLHAHNCYPDQGKWADRIDRALGTGPRPIAIEQDLVWAPARDGGQPVVAHETTLSGNEPTLEAYFFARMAPLLDRALADDRRDTWPIVILHLDFKTNEPAHHRAVWALLGKYARWLTTAPRTADGQKPQPLTPGPLLVLTEQGAGQEAVFHDAVAVGEPLRIFGTIPPAVFPSSGDRAADLRALAAAPVSALITSGKTNYRRWTNHSWAVIESGGQAQAGDWTTADDGRLRSIVERAHELGLWVRFYTLNGHPAGAGQGWTESYNFGSLDAVRPRWRAAIAAGVDFIATDQYEEFR
jgi:hypothetical protein